MTVKKEFRPKENSVGKSYEYMSGDRELSVKLTKI